MQMTEPKIDQRTEQPYVAVRSQINMSDLPTFIPASIDEVIGWLNERKIAPAGVPFIRYHVINMACDMDVEVGFPVERTIAGNGRVQPGVMPAGRYASLIYTGVENGIPGNGALLDWGKAQGLTWDMQDTDLGDAFGGRIEHLIDGPEDDPDPANWRTEVAIKLR